MENRRTLAGAIVATVLLLGAGEMLSALPMVSVSSSVSIAPTSIPVPESGSVRVGMNKVEIATTFSGGTTSVDQVVVRLDATAGVNATDIQQVQVWYEPPGGNGFFDNGGGDYIVGTGTFSGALPCSTTIALNTSAPPVGTEIGASAVARFYVSVDLVSTAAYAAKTMSVQVSSLRQTAKTAIALGPSGLNIMYATQKPLDKYRVGLTATNVAPASAYQGSSTAVLKLVFAPADTDASAAIRLSSLRVHGVGTPRADADTNTGGVILYRDTNSNGAYNAGTDQQVSGAAGTMSGAYATMTPSTPETISNGGTYFIVVNISPSANYVPPNVIGLEIQAPATDLAFADVYHDEVMGPDFASVTTPYDQRGYLVASPAVPSPNSPMITILQQIGQLPPVVQSIDPGNGSSNFARGANITATFSKVMDPTTVTTSTFKIFDGSSNEVPGAVTMDATHMVATFNPTADLQWGMTYTATVYGDGASGVKDSVDGLYMATNRVWSFTTTFAVHPTVLNTSPLNATIEIPRTTAVTATFSKAMTGGSISTATFTLYDGTTPVTGTVGYDAGSRTASFTPTAPSPLAWGKLYTATITTGVRDTDDLAPLSAFQWTFTTTAPVYPFVSATVPPGGQTEVARSSNITATFSKDMLQSSVEAVGSFVLEAPGPVAVPATVTYAAGTATLNPTSDLAWGTTYTATVAAGVQAADALTTQSPFSWSFTTTIPIYPSVLSTVPGDLSRDVPCSSIISIIFSKPMDAGTISDSTISMKRGATTVTGTVVYIGSNTATVTPTGADSPMLWETDYTVTVKSGALGVKSQDGLEMQGADRVFTFKTAVAINPTVVNTVPAPDFVDVLPSAVVTATFSKTMASGTIIDADTTTPPSNFIVFQDLDYDNLYDAGTDTMVAGAVTYDTGTKTATFHPSTALQPGVSYVATITTGVTDADTLPLLSPRVWGFTVTGRPFVTTTVPAAGFVDVLPTAVVTATLSKAMDSTTINDANTSDAGSNFTVFLDANGNSTYDGGDTMVVGSVAWDSGTKTATFSHAAGFAPGVTYCAVITTGFRDATVDHVAMAADKVWSFTTTYRPVVSGTSPPAGFVDVLPSSFITAEFSKTMDPSTLTDADTTDAGSNFIMFVDANTDGDYDGGIDTLVAGSVAIDVGHTVATFTPASTLSPEVIYTATIYTGVRDSSSIAMAANKVWTFTTAYRPGVSATSPAGGLVDVMLSAPITATFSKAMDASTIVDANAGDAGSHFTVFADLNGNSVRDGGETLAGGSVAYNAGTKVATFTPSAALSPELAYCAIITTEVQDATADHIAMAANKVWSFSTSYRPVVSATSPSSGLVDVLPTTLVTATFSKAMDSSTINDANTTVDPSNFILFADTNLNGIRDGAETLVGGTVAWNAGTKVATFTPSALLGPGLTWCATITTGAQDATTDHISMAAPKVWSFTTTNRPVVTATSPANGLVDVLPSSFITATFSRAMASGTLIDANTTDAGSNFILFVDNNTDGDYDGGTDTIVAGSVGIDVSNTVATFTPSTALSPEVTYTAVIYTGVRDSNNIAMAANKVWTFTTSYRPVASATSPSGGLGDVLPTTLVTATFSKAMFATTLDDANAADAGSHFTLFADTNGNSVCDGGETLAGGSVVYNAGTKVATFTPSPALAPGLTYCAIITTAVQDATSDHIAMAANKVWSFTTTSRPVVSSTSPAGGLVDVLPSTLVTATFSKAMDAATINDADPTDAGSHFTLFADLNGNSVCDGGETLVAGTVVYNAGTKMATFAPSPAMSPELTYCAIITTAVQDATADHIAMAADKVWSFTTTNRPVVSATSPSSGFVDVLPSAAVTATFSKAMDSSTIIDPDTTNAGSNFIVFQDANGNSIYDGGDTMVAGSVAWNAGTRVATFSHGAALLPGLTYCAIISASVRDGTADHVPMVADKMWSFTTTYRPTVSNTVPAAGSVDVAPTATVTATFSKAMDSTTIDDADTTNAGSNFIVFADSDSDGLYDAGTDPLVAGSVLYSAGTKVATFTHAAAFVPGVTYVAIISTSVRDATADHVTMAQEKKWSFTSSDRPVVSSTTPAAGFVDVLPSAVVTATFSRPMDPSTIDASTFLLEDSLGVTVPGAVSTDVGTTTWASYTPTAPLIPGATYYATVLGTVEDASVAHIPMVDDRSWSFTVTFRPVVVSTTPAIASVDVLPTDVITATFSKAMDAGSVTDATFQLKAGSTTITGVVTMDPAHLVATFDPASALLPGLTYTATITSAVRDATADHVTMLANRVWSFTTAYRPVVASTEPAPGVVDWLPSAPITATFSKAMDPASIGTASFQLKDGSGNAVPGTVSLDATGAVATFDPTADLAPGVQYTVTITTGAEDATADHITMASSKIWSFTTSYRPAVISKSPASNAVGVSRTTSVKIVFSKAVNPATLTAATFAVTDATAAPVSGAISYDDTTYTATFTPSAALGYQQYTVAVAYGSTGVKDLSGIEMAVDANLTWKFTTIPDLNEPVAANNKIVAGAAGSPVTIFIPQPTANVDDPVTVEVFTATGKKVATLVNNQSYSAIVGNLPLLWDGTNGRSQRLGPGVYFIRITAPGFSRTLKVMVVR